MARGGGHYRESSPSTSRRFYYHRSRSGGAGKFCRVKSSPNRCTPRAGGFENKLSAARATEYIKRVEKGRNTVLGRVLPVPFGSATFKVRMIDGALLTSRLFLPNLAFEYLRAGSALARPCQRARPSCCEPIMKVMW